MKEKLTTLDELGVILGFSDPRSTKKWCEKNGIQVLRAGKKSYVLSVMVDLYFTKHSENFFGAKYANPLEIMEAIKTDNLVELVELIDAPATTKVKGDYRKEKGHSVQTNKFLKTIEAA